MTSSIDLTIAATAARQRGLITRDQLLRCGLARSTIWRRAGSGLLEPVGDRTFRTPAAERSVEADVLAACLELDAVASHRTAGWLHHLLDRPPTIHVTVP
ncbi:MAG: type IV toxin-antitoxin system AbiEi family antitoxin domain-containing protein, partial [Ilumatobacteraceae bacterium]